MPHAPGAAHLRAVLDTNIYVAAFVYPAGRTAALWVAAMDRRYRVLVSPDIIRELARVLRSDFGWEEPRVQTTIRFIAQIAEIVTPRTVVRAITDDPDDNRILECAVEGRADVIVSNDHHLLDVKAFQGIPVIAAPDFRRTLGLR
jgi:uncharacterized protein